MYLPFLQTDSNVDLNVSDINQIIQSTSNAITDTTGVHRVVATDYMAQFLDKLITGIKSIYDAGGIMFSFIQAYPQSALVFFGAIIFMQFFVMRYVFPNVVPDQVSFPVSIFVATILFPFYAPAIVGFLGG